MASRSVGAPLFFPFVSIKRTARLVLLRSVHYSMTELPRDHAYWKTIWRSESNQGPMAACRSKQISSTSELAFFQQIKFFYWTLCWKQRFDERSRTFFWNEKSARMSVKNSCLHQLTHCCFSLCDQHCHHKGHETTEQLIWIYSTAEPTQNIPVSNFFLNWRKRSSAQLSPLTSLFQNWN